jgi:hypothetical protein
VTGDIIEGCPEGDSRVSLKGENPVGTGGQRENTKSLLRAVEGVPHLHYSPQNVLI